jgi:hypothetical protein
MIMSTIYQDRKYVKNPYEFFMQNPPVVHRVSTNTDPPAPKTEPQVLYFNPMPSRNIQMGLVLGPTNNSPGGCGCGAFTQFK